MTEYFEKIEKQRQIDWAIKQQDKFVEKIYKSKKKVIYIINK